jgi:hypothetical protein
MEAKIGALEKASTYNTLLTFPNAMSRLDGAGIYCAMEAQRKCQHNLVW